jgi:transposase-like protein
VDLIHNFLESSLISDKIFIFTISEGKGNRAAIRKVFGETFSIQRSLLHQARHIEEFVPKKDPRSFVTPLKSYASMNASIGTQNERISLLEW